MSISRNDDPFPNDDATWFIVFLDGKQAGPFSMRQLALRAYAGKLKPDDHVQNTKGLCKRCIKASAFSFLQREFTRALLQQQPSQPEPATNKPAGYPAAVKVPLPAKHTSDKPFLVSTDSPSGFTAGPAPITTEKQPGKTHGPSLTQQGKSDEEKRYQKIGYAILLGLAACIFLGLIFANRTRSQVASTHPHDRTKYSSGFVAPPQSSFSVDQSPTSHEPGASKPGSYYDPSYRPPAGEHYVAGHFRQDGTYVQGHFQTNPDDSFWNNWSSKGNVNPHTGSLGHNVPPGTSSLKPLPTFKSSRR